MILPAVRPDAAARPRMSHSWTLTHFVVECLVDIGEGPVPRDEALTSAAHD